MDPVIPFMDRFAVKFREVAFTQHDLQHPHSLYARDSGEGGLGGWAVAGTMASILSVVIAVVVAIIGFRRYVNNPHDDYYLIRFERAVASRPKVRGIATSSDMSGADTIIDNTHGDPAGRAMTMAIPPGVKHFPTRPSPAFLGRSTWPL